MSIARINSIEFETEEDLKERIRFLEDQKINPPTGAECHIQIQPRDTSLLGILIYPNQETADATLELREKVMSSTKQKDSW